MSEPEASGPRRVRLERPERHHQLIVTASGDHVATSDGRRLDARGEADDRAIWTHQAGTDRYRHAVTGLVLALEPSAAGPVLRCAAAPPSLDGARVSVRRGPSILPSESLRRFTEQGWVCLPCVLEPETLDGLQRVARIGEWREGHGDPPKAPLLEDVAVARAAVEPVSLWLVRQYLRTDDIRLGHSPSLAVMDPDDGERDLLAWHADFPYLWGVTEAVGGDRIPVHDAGPYALGVQRNVCISDFTQENGATGFKLGSHARCGPPPEAWGTGAAYARRGHRREHGLPYAGPESDVIEAPAGSVVLYDARTWHRAGVNRTGKRRAALLQAMTPGFIMPFKDTSRPYRSFLSSALPDALTARERRDLENLMVHRIVGPEGEHAIGIDDVLTGRVRRGSGPGG